MLLKIKSGADGTTVDVTRVLVATARDRCPLCWNELVSWRMPDMDVLATTDIAKTPLGASEAGEECINALLADGTISVAAIDGDSF